MKRWWSSFLLAGYRQLVDVVSIMLLFVFANKRCYHAVPRAGKGTVVMSLTAGEVGTQASATTLVVRESRCRRRFSRWISIYTRSCSNSIVFEKRDIFQHTRRPRWHLSLCISRF